MPTSPAVAIVWECVANGSDEDRFSARLLLRNQSGAAIAPGWALYFNTCRKVVPQTVSEGFTIAHVNGDLFRLTRVDAVPWLPDEAFELTYQARFWAVSLTDAPLGFYLVTAGGAAIDLGDPAIVPFTRPAQLQRHRDDQVAPMDAARRFEESGAVSLLPPGEVGRITPRPLAAVFGGGQSRIGCNARLRYAPGLDEEAAFLRTLLAALPLAPEIDIVLDTGPVSAVTPAADEAYLLEIERGVVRLRGTAPHGVFNGLQTLRQLLEPDGHLPIGRVRDAPRFAYRGMMLDVARHFADVETVLRLLDCMALYKLNRFHFHLTDDEGWRLPITALPELTEVGARRGVPGGGPCLPPSFGSGARVDASSGSGHYSHADFIRILRHAQARHIEVIPEFNMPGHARAAVQAMRVRHDRLLAAGDPAGADACRLDDPDDTSRYESVQLWHDNVICIARPSCDRFVETVVSEVAALYREAGVVLRTVHLGGDEVPAGAWLGSPICRASMARHGWTDVHELRADFTARCRAILARHGLAFAGWDDNALAAAEDGGVVADPRFAGPGFQVYAWNNAVGSGQEDCAWRLANAGYDVVLANAAHLYFDLAHAKDPEEPGYYWAGFVDTRTVFGFRPLGAHVLTTLDQMGRPLPDQAAARLVGLAAPQRILGLQGQLWGENARSRARIEYLAAPRLLALAERAWSQDPGRQDGPAEAAQAWNEFANRLGQRALPQLDRTLGYGYRLPPPGVVARSGRIHANIALPGLVLRFTVDGSAPHAGSPQYTAPLPVPPGATAFNIASFDTCGRASRVVTLDLKDLPDA